MQKQWHLVDEGPGEKSRRGKVNVKVVKIRKWFSTSKFKLLSEPSVIAFSSDIVTETDFFLDCCWCSLVLWHCESSLKITTVIVERFRITMATESTTDEGNYKREYRRIKSLVSSAYVRQTSVSSVLFKSEFWQNSQDVLGIRTCYCDCYVTDVIYSIYYPNWQLQPRENFHR